MPALSIKNLTPKELKDKCLRAYTAANITLFPVVFAPNDKGVNVKRPKFKGWQNKKFLPLLQVKDMHLPATYGVLLPDDIVVIDVDPRNYAPGEDQLASLLKILGLTLSDFKTYIVQTGSSPKRGLHIYLRVPPGMTFPKKMPNFPAIDIKRIGGYVVGAGSLNPQTGKYYEPRRGTPSKIMDCPAVLLQYMIKPTQGTLSSRKSEDGYQSDDEMNQQRFISYVNNLTNVPTQGNHGDDRTVAIAMVAWDYGLSEPVAYQLMNDYLNPRCIPPWNPTDLATKVRSAYKSAKGAQGSRNPQNDFKDIPITKVVKYPEHTDFDIARDGTFKGSLKNVVSCFLRKTTPSKHKNKLYGLIRYNTFSNTVVFKKRPPWLEKDEPLPIQWTDSDTDRLMYYLSRNWGIDAQEAVVFKALTTVSRYDSFHPVCEYILNCYAKWDHKPRLDNLLTKYAGAVDNAYVRSVSKNMLIAAVKRVFYPGCQHDHIPILESSQGKGKTTFVRILGGEWFTDAHIDPRDKDTAQNLADSWICEWGEMRSHNAANRDALKAFITRTTDKYRPSYGRVSIRFPRQSIFIGTQNPDSGNNGWMDDEENRRYWPIRICETLPEIDRKALIRDRDHLFAEAYHRMLQDEPIFISDPEIKKLELAAQTARRSHDIWEDTLSTGLQDTKDMPPLTAGNIATAVLNIPMAQQNRGILARISTCMRKLGWKKIVKRIDGIRQHIWVPESEDDFSDISWL